MTVHLLVRATVFSEHRTQFEQAYAVLQAKVVATEDGVLKYDMYRVIGSETDYRLIETYASQAAFDFHVNNPETQAEVAELIKNFANEPDVELLEICS